MMRHRVEFRFFRSDTSILMTGVCSCGQWGLRHFIDRATELLGVVYLAKACAREHSPDARIVPIIYPLN